MENSKERVSGLFFCNSDGSEKEKVLVIGKSARPRAFKHLDFERDLPVTYKSNRKAWMTGEIFEECLRKFDKKMRHLKRHALVFLDNATSHHVAALEKELKNTKLQFLPPNTTSKLQPLDQGIIRSWKAKYKHLLLTRIVSNIDSGETATEIAKSINILDVCRWSASAWDSVTAITIRNCFKKAGFHQDAQEDDDEDDLPLQALINRIPTAELSADEFPAIEDEIPSSEHYSDANWEEEILDEYRPLEQEEVMETEDSDER